MKTMVKRLAILGVASSVLGTLSAARAQDEDGDHDRARDLYEHGEIVGLADIMAIVRSKAPGEIVAVDLLQTGGKWIYRFQVITTDGRRRIVDVDARARGVLTGEGDGK